MTQPPLPKELTAMALVVTASSPRQALLLQSRKHNLWMPPGGHVEPGENIFEAAIREAKEETGLDITPYLPKPAQYDENRVEVPLPARIVEVHLTHGGKEHYHVDCMYRVEVPTALSVQRNDRETSDIRWVTLAELDDLAIPADLLPVLKEELAN